MDEKEFREKFSWHCVGHKPTRWALGIQDGQQLTNIVARCTRLRSGPWVWFPMFTHHAGLVEPSLDCAIEAAQKYVLENLDKIETEGAYQVA